MTKYGRSPWIDSFPKSRVPSYPRHRNSLAVDVVIVGGGLTGCTAAYAFAAAGVKVALIEAGAIGRGSSGASNGWIAEAPAAPFADVERALGLRAARHAFQAWRRAALDFGALLRRLGVKSRFEPHPTFLIAASPEQSKAIARELKSRRDAGLDASAVRGPAAAAETGMPAVAALKTRDGATIDPYRATLGLAAAATARGARLFERSAAGKIAFTPKHVDVHTEGGSIRADRVVVATGVPTPLFKSLARHFWFHTAFLALTEPIAARIRKQLGRRTAVVRDACAPPHVVRWVDDDRLLITGADAALVPDRALDKVLVQRTGQLMYELSVMYPDISGIQPAYGWAAAYARTAEGLPYIGPHRNFPRHLFAFGDSSHSVTGAYLASRMLLRHFLGEPDAADEAFAFTR